MGYMRHHAICITSCSADYINAAKEEAERLGCTVAGPTPKAINGYRSIFVAPDGSKEGWDDSAEGDRRRAELIDWLHGQAFSDGSSMLDWVEVQYGDDDMETKVCRDSDERCRAEDADGAGLWPE